MKKLMLISLWTVAIAMVFGYISYTYSPSVQSSPESLEQIRVRVQEESGRARAERAREQVRVRKAEKNAQADATRATILEECFGSLASIQSAIPEVRWIRYDRNSVHIGFNPIPFDIKAILGGHAFAGWSAINFGCHIYAYDASRYSPTTDGNFFAGATCRYGKIKHY